MEFIDNLKIGKRLGFGWGISLLLMLLTVLVSFIYFNKFQDKIDYVANVNNAKIDHSINIIKAFSEVSYNAGIIAASNDSNMRSEAKKRIDAARALYGKSLEGLEKLENSVEGKALLTKIKEEVPKRREQTNKVLELGMAGNSAQATREYPLLVNNLINIIALADDMVKYNQKRAAIRAEEAKGDALFAMYLLLSIGAGNLILGLLMARYITKSITFPIFRAASHIELMAKGDFSIPVSEHGKKRKDEFGSFARSMDIMNVSLKTMLEHVRTSSANVSSAGTRFKEAARQLSTGATEQVQRAMQVAAATTEMNQASEDIAKNASSMTESAKDAVMIAKEGQQIVQKAIDEVNIIAQTVEIASDFVKKLGDQSEKIGAIVTVIEDIANQTNLLALNAAIEAARAGEHGRGFAVVADEVRKLAERTSTSTTEIGSMIHSITAGVQSTVDSMNTAQQRVTTGVEFSYQTQAALDKILTSIDTVSNGIHQVATAIEEMSATTDEISRDINRISDFTQETSQSSERIVSESDDLSRTADELQRTVQKFKT